MMIKNTFVNPMMLSKYSKMVVYDPSPRADFVARGGLSNSHAFPRRLVVENSSLLYRIAKVFFTCYDTENESWTISSLRRLNEFKSHNI